MTPPEFELEQATRRVTIDVPDRVMSTFMAQLGELAAAHDLPVAVDDTQSDLVHYNKNLTTPVQVYDLLLGRRTDEQVLAVTRANLREFAPTIGFSSNLGSMAFRGVSEYMVNIQQYKDCIVATEKPGRDHPLNCWGIRAAKMPRVMEALENTTEFRRQLTPRQFEVFSGFHQALFATST